MVVRDCDTPEEPGKASSSEESCVPSPVPVQFARAKQAVALENGQQDRASECVKVHFRVLVEVGGEWMIGVEVKALPEERYRGVGDGAGGISTSDMVSEALDRPICA